ncbi:MAG: transposase [Proteobacteria bacterium]|nr:transposase [Pseudomonadota bacterium]
MTRPRSQLVVLEATPYYHCISRCVRRAFLCGEDRFTGKSFDHRKPWLVERLALLVETFAIDIAAYAVMSNHYHVVLHIDQDRAENWSDDEVVNRWTRLYKGPLLIQRLQAGHVLSAIERALTKVYIDHFRRQLANLSRFMACLNEYIARRANQEDCCSGRFWEGRFKSQALLDESALLSCMTYVDLNPIRAGIAPDLFTSGFTSVQDRLRQIDPLRVTRAYLAPFQLPRLLPFTERSGDSNASPLLPCRLQDYLAVVDWTGRVVRADKRGFIQQQSPVLLQQLGLSQSQWGVLALEIQKQSVCMLNGLVSLEKLERRAARHKAA